MSELGAVARNTRFPVKSAAQKVNDYEPLSMVEVVVTSPNLHLGGVYTSPIQIRGKYRMISQLYNFFYN